MGQFYIAEILFTKLTGIVHFIEIKSDYAYKSLLLIKRFILQLSNHSGSLKWWTVGKFFLVKNKFINTLINLVSLLYTLWAKNNWRIFVSISFHVCVWVCMYVCVCVILILLKLFLTWFWASLFILMIATWEYVPFSVNFVKVRLTEETVYLILWAPGKWPKLHVSVFICKSSGLNLS